MKRSSSSSETRFAHWYRVKGRRLPYHCGREAYRAAWNASVAAASEYVYRNELSDEELADLDGLRDD